MAKVKEASETPLMKQYNAIKAKYPGALLLFRVGDFYETFGEDAIKASKILGIILTKRGAGSPNETALAGFPYHSLDVYLPKLVRAGERVAICDQLEDPKSVKGIVKRGVTELVTPGVSLNDNVLEVKRNNYLASVHFGKDLCGISFLDISTGEFFAAQGSLNYIDKLVQSLQPSEILFCKNKKSNYFEIFGDKFSHFMLEDWVYTFDYAYETLTKQFKTQSLKGFGIEEMEEAIISAGAILNYLSFTEHKEIAHISSIARMDEEKYVWLDKFTIRNLELLYTQIPGGVPLVDVIDQTITPMGARLMRNWLILPLKEIKQIEERQEITAHFLKNQQLSDSLATQLKIIGDLERIISKVAARRINPKELSQLKRALQAIEPIKNLLLGENTLILKKIADKINVCEFLREKIENELREDVPLITTKGGLIKEGIDAELDELRKIAYSGKDYLVQITQREIERTGISSLKIAYNNVFGYYLEVTNVHKNKVPAEWIRKQTTTNAERYITEELKVYEDKILNAEDQIFRIEQRIYDELVLCASDFVNEIQQNAKVLSFIDCLLSFSVVAQNSNYVQPKISESKILNIKAGRHPVIEKQLPIGEEYVPNDIFLDDETQQIMIITGPNMAGKSALLRQVALIVLMAQIGAFVPAESAEIGIVDKVFTRVGASDNLSKGESTFMVEMTETASILNNLSERSLILMDEIGRGTSTYDGISIAWSIVEFLHNHPKCKAKTLFATHYHELNELAVDFKRVKNFNVSVKEVGNKVVFMRKLVEGGSEHSFGIHVAQMAGLPNTIVLRANEIMHELEKDKSRENNKKKLQEAPKANFQLSLFEPSNPKFVKAQEMLEVLDINTISPVEALLKLNEIKGLMKNEF